MTGPLASLTLPSSRQLLARILETADLEAQVQALQPPVLARLIESIGVEDAGEIVAFATTEQLEKIFDEDLWRSARPGDDERFDAGRFLVWLEVMLEAGDAFVAAKLVELPEELVTLAFHKQVLVLSMEGLAAEIQSAGEEGSGTDKALSNCLSEELEDHMLLSRQSDGWDNVLSALLALDRDHHDFLQRLLDRCCRMSEEYVDDNGGLYEVLTSEEMLEGDLAADREDRRSEVGHVSPSSAAAFLKLAREAAGTPFTQHDPMTRAYFRGLSKGGGLSQPARAPQAHPSKSHALLRILAEAGVAELAEAPRLLPAASADGVSAEPLMTEAMRRLGEESPALFEERSEEIAYLANVLAAGFSLQGRRLRPIEAVRGAIRACSVGLDLRLEGRARHGEDRVGVAVAILRECPADGLFRLAWSRTPDVSSLFG